MRKIDSLREHAIKHRKLSLVLCDDVDEWNGWGGREVQEEGDIGIHIVDSVYCTVETNTTL